MQFLLNNYDWIVSLFLLAMLLVQGKKISLLNKRIKKMEEKYNGDKKRKYNKN